MTTETQPQHPAPIKAGDFCHFEYPVKDRARAKKFYGEVFGWSFVDVPEMNYTLFRTPGGQGGGFFEPSEGMPEAVINFLAVESIEKTAAQVVAHGGKVLGEKIEVPGHGHMLHVMDSEGSVFALWRAH
ncbi:MAG TPA: VOC family protein [Oscillatoriaceae cyanobacterium]